MPYLTSKKAICFPTQAEAQNSYRSTAKNPLFFTTSDLQPVDLQCHAIQLRDIPKFVQVLHRKH